jgi:hypothetical protein
MLFKQVQMTAAATPGTTVWVYRCSVYAYPWYTSVRTLLDDPAYAPWFINFKTEGPWYSPKCDNNFTPPKCSDHYHMQVQLACQKRGGKCVGGCLCVCVCACACEQRLCVCACVGSRYESISTNHGVAILLPNLITRMCYTHNLPSQEQSPGFPKGSMT